MIIWTYLDSVKLTICIDVHFIDKDIACS